MNRYKYKAVRENGQSIRGVLTAVNSNDLHAQLKAAGLDLVKSTVMKEKKGSSFAFLNKVKVRDLIQFFINLKQMQGAGIGILDSLADLRDSSDNAMFRDVLTGMYRDVSEGSSLSEAMASHPKIFANIHISLVAAGEENGDIQTACEQLVFYLKWVDAMQTRVRKATRYPMVLMLVVILTVVVMMKFVVPQIVGFLQNLDQELPLATTSLVATSDFFQIYWWAILATPVLLIFGLMTGRKASERFAYKVDAIMLKLPVMGKVIRKISVARFSQTFSALFKGGIDIIKALQASSHTVNNLVLKAGLHDVEAYVKQGDPISTALNKSGQFPSMVVRMVRVGEESGNLSEVLDQVAEFYTNDVDEEVQKVITMIEPSLTAILGVMILWIAVGVFGPIYASFESIDF